MKKIVLAVLDTETCPIVKQDKVDAHNMLTYDLGYSIVDLHGNVYLERSFVIVNTFFGEEEKMTSSYYTNKLPQYLSFFNSQIANRFSTLNSIVKLDSSKYLLPLY